MPVYEYRCDECNKDYAKSRGINDSDPGYSCETCNTSLVRVYSKVGAVFNGSGFYSTDNRKRQYTLNMIDEHPSTQVEWELSPKDRCDSCAAEALVKVSGISGELMFCGHHYNSIMNDEKGYKSMMSFALTILDERDKLIENKAKGKDY